MELKLYNDLKQKLLKELAPRAEAHDSEYQGLVEQYASAQHTGIPKPMSRKILRWLQDYNRLQHTPFQLRYYQILALFFTEHLLAEKRAGNAFIDQKALAYWMATGSGKTLLMHLNILQYIEHIGGGQAFDELQIILTTPGVNLIEQHERELGEVVGKLNALYNNRIRLTVATTGSLLSLRERHPGYFQLPDSHRLFRLVLVDEGHIGLASGGQAVGAFKQLRHELLEPENAFLFEYSATYHGIAEKHVQEYESQIIYDYNYYRFFRDGYGKDYAFQSKNDDRFADMGKDASAFFEATFSTLENKLQAHQALEVSHFQRKDELPFSGHFPDRPLLAFMGNTVEDPSNEGKLNKQGEGNDEVSDIRRLVVWLAHLSQRERDDYTHIFNGQTHGRLTLTRAPGISDEIWLSWGNGDYWGLINVGNGEKFFRDCEEHPQLHNAKGEVLVSLAKAPIIDGHYHFSAIDEPRSPINVLIGSRKFAEGWNCFRVSSIGLINLGASKGNKIIQIFGRGVRLKGLRGDGKRRHLEHCNDYTELVEQDDADTRLQRLETLNVYSLRRSWLETFLKALEKDIPAISGPYAVEVAPAVVEVGRSDKRTKTLSFDEYCHKLHAFKVGQREFDSPLRVTLDATSHHWHWAYEENGQFHSGQLANKGFNLDYRADRESDGVNLSQDLQDLLRAHQAFTPAPLFDEQSLTWQRQQRVQCYVERGSMLTPMTLDDLLTVAKEVRYDAPLNKRQWLAVERLLGEVQRDLLEKMFHRVRYDIDKRHYRYEPVLQSQPGRKGDFIDRYLLTYEFEKQEHKEAFEQDKTLRPQLENQLNLLENKAPYHIYDPLLAQASSSLLGQPPFKKAKLKGIGISPDSLNPGERKFLDDMLDYIERQYARDHREFYLMRNVESLRSIGLYLVSESRVFYPDFVLWIVDEKANQTTLALFDPKGQTGIVSEDDLGLHKSSGMNEKVEVANGGQLAELARSLQQQTKLSWSVYSYILLRDSSPLGRFKGGAPNDGDMKKAESMIQRHVLRLDWHDRNEKGERSSRLLGNKSYLNKIFEELLP